MSSTSGWETVTGKKGVKNVSKGFKKTNLESMPRIQPTAPVKESPTIYHAFLQEELRKERKLLEGEKENKEAKKTTSNNLLKKKEKRLPLRESLLNIDFNEVESSLKKDEASFPKNPEIWLKNLASFLNYRLDHISDSDPILADKPHDYPFCFLSDEAKEFFLNKMKKFNSHVYESLFDYCLDYIMNAISKDQSSLGYRLTIQLLLRVRPEVVINNFSKYEGLLQKNASRPLRSLCILWAVGKVGSYSLAHGIKVWFALMFGLINVKNLNNHVMNYLESLFERFTDLQEGFDVINKTEYFKYFGEIYSELSPLPGDIRKRLQQLYPRIKTIVWGNVSKNLNLFFLGYLTRLTTDCHEAKKAELLQCLLACLQGDVQSFSHWRKDYQKTLHQSSILLRYLRANMDKFPSNRKVFLETIRSFQTTNEELRAKLPPGNPALQSCEESCNAILTKFKKSNYSLVSFLLSSMVILVALMFSVDVYLQGSFEDSLTHHYLSELGAMPILHEAFQRSVVVSGWIGENTTKGLKMMCELTESFISTLEKTEIIKEYKPRLQKMFGTISDKMVQLTPQLLHYLDMVSQLYVDGLTWVSLHAVELFTSIQSFMSEKVFVGCLSPETMLQQASQLLMVVHEALIDLFSKIRPQ